MGAEEETAMNGVWKKGPAGDLFEALDKVCCHAHLLFGSTKSDKIIGSCIECAGS